MPLWQRAKRRSGGGQSLGLALVLFLLLCGAALVLTGRERAPAPKISPAMRAQQAIHALDQAGQALKTTDYGKARKHLARARATLEVLAATIKQ